MEVKPTDAKSSEPLGAAAKAAQRGERFGMHHSFGLSRGNILTWLSAALLIASAVLRIVYYASGGKEGYSLGSWRTFLMIILPVAAAVFFAAEVIIHGRDRLYKIGFAVLLGTAFFAARIFALYNEGDAFVSKPWHVIASLVLYAAALIIWELTSNAARIKTKWLAVLVFTLPLLYHLFVNDIPSWTKSFNLHEALPEISVLLIMAGLAAAAWGLELYSSEGYRPRRGDRCDGRLVRSLDPMNGVAIYIMPNRNGAATYYRDSFECAKVEEYIRQKRAEGLDSFGIMHVIAAAYVRVISQRPAMNRFISGQKIFTRDGEIELAMAVKKEMTAEAPETIIKVYFEPTDTAYDVYRKYNEQVQLAKDTPLDSGFDNLAGLINAVPGIFKKFLVWVLKCFDYFGWLPRFILKLSPFHGSIFITSLGSLGIQPVFHHLYDFGNMPIFVAFGSRRTVTETDTDGSPVRRKYLDFTVVSDERISDGFYYASSIKMFRRFLNNPDKLDTPPEQVINDVY